MTTVFTVGHSNHEGPALAALLRQHGVRLVADVRSSPYSRHVPQANRETLSRSLQAAGIGYRWLGDRLGGKPEGVVADYDELRASPAFKEGIDTLLTLATEQPTAILCAEGSHRHCHRFLLITPVLVERGARVLHIQPDGSVVDEGQEPKQLALF